MTNISRFAYKATWDATELTKGLMNTRALFAAQKKIVEDSRSPFDRLAIGQENLNKLVEKFPELASQKLRLEQQLEKQYLLEERAIRKLDAAERERLRSMMTAEEKEAEIAVRRQRRAARMEKLGQRVNAKFEYQDMAEADAARNKQAMIDGPNWAQSASSMRSSQGSGFGGTARLVGAIGAAYAAKDFIRDSVQANRDIERAANTFDHFSGKVGTSATMIARLRDMSAELGVSFKSMTSGASQLMLKGFSSDETLKRMSQLAQVAGGDTEKMNRLATAMAQVKDKGRFYAEEMMQLQEAGFSPTIELAQVLGVKLEDVRKEMEKGNVTWVELGKALDKATQSGGRYYGYLEKLKDTSVGAANAAAAAWENAHARIGEAMAPFDVMASKVSSWVANDLSQSVAYLKPDLSKLITKPAELSKFDKEMQERRTKADEYFKKQQERESEQAKKAEPGLIDERFNLVKQLVSKEDLEKFERQYELLTDFNKELAKTEAIENALNGLGLGDMSSKFDAKTLAEWNKNEEIRQKVDREAQKKRDREEFQARTQRRADTGAEMVRDRSLDSMMNLVTALERGMISAAEFDQQSRGLVSEQIGQSYSRLAPSLTVGSREEYRASVGIYDKQMQEDAQFRKETAERDNLKIKAINELKEEVKGLKKNIGVEK